VMDDGGFDVLIGDEEPGAIGGGGLRGGATDECTSADAAGEETLGGEIGKGFA